MLLESYDDVLKSIAKSKGRKFHLLLGNGFSMAYDKEIFSYNALHDFIQQLDNELLSKLFDIVKTKNFELIMQQLDNFESLISVFGNDEQLKTKVRNASSLLKGSLLEAIRSLHPEHVFEIPKEKSQACAVFLGKFLGSGGHVYTTNYDLLLYWVLMRNPYLTSVDGFGREVENPDEYVPLDELEFSELRWGKHKDNQDIYYLHGALPIFDTGVEIIKEQYDSEHYLLENISARIDRKQYPIFVTAGNGREKLEHIMHNKYLTYCYDTFTQMNGSLVTFGFNFGQYDEHIIDAINIAAHHGHKAPEKLWSIYIGVYSDENRRYIESIEPKFKCKVHIFDAKTAPVWG
jgi:hypothetical protein